MLIITIVVALCCAALLACRSVLMTRQRAAALRRRGRMIRSVANQKAWDVVFGRRIQRHFLFQPPRPRND